MRLALLVAFKVSSRLFDQRPIRSVMAFRDVLVCGLLGFDANECCVAMRIGLVTVLLGCVGFNPSAFGLLEVGTANLIHP